jgi:hypothetical protein
MWHAVRFTMIGLMIIALGCVSTVERDRSDADRAVDRARISRSHSWAFLKHDAPAHYSAEPSDIAATYRVTSPLRNAYELDAKVADFIENALKSLGFERAGAYEEADLYVDYELILRPMAQTLEGNFSQRYISSFSNAPSYIIEGTEITRYDYEDLLLAIDLREERGRPLWRRELKQRLKALEPLGLRVKVENLIGALPNCSVR